MSHKSSVWCFLLHIPGQVDHVHMTTWPPSRIPGWIFAPHEDVTGLQGRVLHADGLQGEFDEVATPGTSTSRTLHKVAPVTLSWFGTNVNNYNFGLYSWYYIYKRMWCFFPLNAPFEKFWPATMGRKIRMIKIEWLTISINKDYSITYCQWGAWIMISRCWKGYTSDMACWEIPILSEIIVIYNWISLTKLVWWQHKSLNLK